jgi:glucose dehydrogenase
MGTVPPDLWIRSIVRLRIVDPYRKPSTAVTNALFSPATRGRAQPATSFYQGATLMKTFASAAAVLLLLGVGASAQTLDDLKKDGKNTDNILTYGMGYHLQRHSPLKQIN